MIEWIIRRSVANRFLVMMGPCFSASGAHGRLLTRLSMPCLTCQMCRSLSKPAIPAGPADCRKPVTYPLTTMLSVRRKTVRGFHSSVIRMCMSF